MVNAHDKELGNYPRRLLVLDTLEADGNCEISARSSPWMLGRLYAVDSRHFRVVFCYEMTRLLLNSFFLLIRDETSNLFSPSVVGDVPFPPSIAETRV